MKLFLVSIDTIPVVIIIRTIKRCDFEVSQIVILQIIICRCLPHEKAKKKKDNTGTEQNETTVFFIMRDFFRINNVGIGSNCKYSLKSKKKN